MNQIRREKIGKYVCGNGAVSVREISALFPEVSLMTIHRDLEKLEDEGIIVRTRGGAIPASQSNGTEAKLETRMQTNMTGKRRMAEKAVKLIEKGSAVFFDAGTSNMALVRALPDMDLNIFTTGPNIATELSRLTNPTIHMCGGTLNRSNQAVSGASTLAMLEDINIATAFIGVSGFTPEVGFTCGKEEEMLVKRLVLQKATCKVILMDSTKYGKLLPYTFGDLKDADYIISDDGLPAEFMERAQREGATVL